MCSVAGRGGANDVTGRPRIDHVRVSVVKDFADSVISRGRAAAVQIIDDGGWGDGGLSCSCCCGHGVVVRKWGDGRGLGTGGD